VYVSDSTGNNFILRDSTPGFSSTIDGLTNSQLYFFQVASVNATGIEGERSNSVSTRVVLLEMTINSNLAYTNRRDVTIQLIAPFSSSTVLLSEDSTFSDAVYESFNVNKNFRLSIGDGNKMVYGRIMFSDGSETGALLSDEIILDTRSRINSVAVSPSDETFTADDTVAFFLDGGEQSGTASVSFGGLSPVSLFDDGLGVDAGQDDGVYSGQYVVPTNLNLKSVQVTGNFTDAAGNRADPLTANTTLSIESPPMPVELTQVEALSSFEVELRWAGEVEADFTSYRVYRDISSSVTTSSDLVTTVHVASTKVFVDVAVADNTTYYYRVYVTNTSGLSAGSNIASATTLVNTPPNPVVLAATLGIEPSSAVLTWSRNNDHDFASYRIFRNNSPASPDDLTLLVGLISNQDTLRFDDVIPSAWPTAYYYIYVSDLQGLVSGPSNVIQVDK
jgi:hypothetical protein